MVRRYLFQQGRVPLSIFLARNYCNGNMWCDDSNPPLKPEGRLLFCTERPLEPSEPCDTDTSFEEYELVKPGEKVPLKILL